MSGIRESNPLLILGKDAYYHCTNPATYLLILPSYLPRRQVAEEATNPAK